MSTQRRMLVGMAVGACLAVAEWNRASSMRGGISTELAETRRISIELGAVAANLAGAAAALEWEPGPLGTPPRPAQAKLQLAEALRSGRFLAGERLPETAALAGLMADLSTLASELSDLRVGGWFSTRAGLNSEGFEICREALAEKAEIVRDIREPYLCHLRLMETADRTLLWRIRMSALLLLSLISLGVCAAIASSRSSEDVLPWSDTVEPDVPKSCAAVTS